LGGSLPSTLIDDFEDQSRNGATPHRLNLWGSPWNTVVLNSSIGVTFNAPGLSSRYSAGVTGFMGMGNAYAIFQCPLLSSFTQPVNVACHGLKGVQFWIMGDGNRYRVEVPNAAVTDGHDWYGYEFTAPAGEWSFFQVPFEKMTRRYSGSQGDLPENLDGTDVSGIQFFPLRNGAFGYSLDTVGFYGDYIPQCPPSPSGPAPAAKQPPLPTATPLGYGCPPTFIDDFEDPGPNSGATRTNRMGGTWKTGSSPDADVAAAYDAPGADGTRFSARMAGSRGQPGEGRYASLQTTLGAGGAPYDAAGRGLGGIQFWMKGDGQAYSFTLTSTDETGKNQYLFPLYRPGGDWTFVQIPFAKMVRKSWLVSRLGQEPHFNGSNITLLEFSCESRGAFSFQIDQLAFFCGPATPTPLPTRSFTPTAVPSTPTHTPAPLRRVPPPSPTPLPWVPPRPKPSPTPFRIAPRPSAVPRPKPTPVGIRPTSTPSRPRWTPTPIPLSVPPPTSTLPPAKARPTAVPTWLPHLDLSQTIEFNAPPANVYVEFADGPGQYRVEVVDASGNLLQSIFDGKVVGQNDQWLEWDGRDARGKDTPPGRYFVVVYKDGRPLRSLSVLRTVSGSP